MDIKIYDKLAKKYDFMVRVVSFGIEEIWRRVFLKEIKKHIKNGSLIDVASATGEMARVLDFDKMYLIEPSSEMVRVIIEKFKEIGFKEEKFEVSFKERPHIRLKKGKKEVIVIEEIAERFWIDERVDLVVSFMGIRNFDDIQKGINNLDKHLKNGGYFAIVEMVKSESLLGRVVLWYMNKIVPLIAGLFGMKKEYKELGRSIASLSEEDILKHFSGYDIILNKSLFPIAKMFIFKKEK